MGDFGQRRDSLFRGSQTAHRLQPWTVAAARRKSRPELSVSLLNRPRWVNNSVRTAAQTGFRTACGGSLGLPAHP